MPTTLPYIYCKIWQAAKAELYKMKIYMQHIMIDKQFIKISLIKAVRYVYTCVYINPYVYTYVKAFTKEKIVQGT